MAQSVKVCEEWHKQRVRSVTASKFNAVANAIDKKKMKGHRTSIEKSWLLMAKKIKI